MKIILCFLCHFVATSFCASLASFEAFPFALVVAHLGLVVEAVDLDRHGFDIFRERKHRR